MIKTINFIIAATLALSIGVAHANPSSSSAPAATSKSKHMQSFLFVVNADSAKITKSQNGGYILELDRADINHAIMFSDRPNRIVKIIKGQDLAKIWSKGSDSFATDPPNGVLTANDLKPVVVQLNSHAMNGDKVTFKMTGNLSNIPSALHNPSLIIDAYQMANCWLGICW